MTFAPQIIAVVNLWFIVHTRVRIISNNNDTHTCTKKKCLMNCNTNDKIETEKYRPSDAYMYIPEILRREKKKSDLVQDKINVVKLDN